MSIHYSYSRDSVKNSLRKLPIGSGDLIYCHSAIGYFGMLEGCNDQHILCEVFFDAIMEIIGPSGTLIVPTYTYSFPQGQIFDVENGVSNMGMFSEWIRAHPDSVRTNDPSFSAAIIGNDRNQFLQCRVDHSFGRNSVFEKFYKYGGKVLCLNFPGNTFLHFVERELGVRYRFDKTFLGRSVEGKELVLGWSTIFVRYLSDDALKHCPKGFEKLSRERGYQQYIKLGRGEISSIGSADVFRLVEETLRDRPYFLTKAEALGVNNPKISVEETVIKNF